MAISKIAILGTRGIPARYGGFETFADEIAQRLVREGISVTVFCEDTGGEQPKQYCGASLKYVPAPRLGPFTTIVYDLRCLWRARRGYDVVYMLGYGVSLFCFLPRLFGTRVWINMDGLEWARSKWSWTARVWLKTMEAMAMWTPNRIIADAEAIRTNLAMRYRHMPNASVIPYGAVIVDQPPSTHILEEWNLHPDSYYLLVCRLEPENHVLEILRGYAATGSSLPLIVVGDHRHQTPYVTQLLAVQDTRIHFVGSIYEQEKLRTLRFYCRAYFHGHCVGGTNPSLLEAMGCGNAVIAHDNPFNREVAGDAAHYFTSESDLSILVEQLEKNEADRTAMRYQARKIIANRYTWEMVTGDYLSLLNRLKS